MIEVVLAVAGTNAIWLRHFSYLAPAGLPLMFGALGVWWIVSCFPAPVYSFATTPVDFASDIFTLTILIDLSQTMLHRLAHTRLRHTFIGRSHAVHHKHTHPKPEDAFNTGVVDAFFQLVIPLLVVVHCIRPSRGALGVFGCAYSWWLNFLHSPPAEYPRLRWLGLVTPTDHQLHHRDPTRNFSNILAWL